MTFTTEDIDGIRLSESEDWKYNWISESISVPIHGLESYAERFFGVDLENEYQDSWIDSYIEFDHASNIVLDVFFVLHLNKDGSRLENIRELKVGFTNLFEAHKICEKLMELGGTELKGFIKECFEREKFTEWYRKGHMSEGEG